MATRHVKWTDTEGFHVVRKSVQIYPQILRGDDVVTYAAKVKLHGTNAGVLVYPDGKVRYTSRERLIAPGNDNQGFAAWASQHEAAFSALAVPDTIVTIFGEWCGIGGAQRVKQDGNPLLVPNYDLRFGVKFSSRRF